MSRGTTRYVLGRRLGSGGMAEVFEGLAHGLGAFERRVAIERIRPAMAAIPEARRAFFDEALIASALHHANIVSIVDYGDVDGTLFQVFELVDGLNLRDLRTAIIEPGGVVEETLALAIGLEIAHALAYAHELRDENGAPRKIVHRDVSPQNILISWAGDVKLCDFGVALATKRTDKTETGFIKGNLAYMAPEQAAAEAVDGRADVFALAAVLHWFLRGNSPVEGKGARVVRTDPPLASDLSADLAQILREATRVLRDDRTPNMRVLTDQLSAALAARRSADQRAIVLAAMDRVKISKNERPPIDDLFRASIVLDGELDGVRRFMSVARPPPTLPTSGSDSTDDTDEQPLVEVSDDSEEIAVGKMVGGLELVEQISHGGFAFVYRAQHPVLGREYAVKILRSRADSPKNRRRLEREARALAAIDHPNIVALHDFGTTGGRPYLVTELLAGPTLWRVLSAHGPLKLDLILAIGTQLAGALAHVHALGLIHRDLKPANVILTNPSPASVKLVDFGIARLASLATNESFLTSSDDMLGTPLYMAPEQARDPTAAESRTDLYALGCVLYALATGRPPFEGSRDRVLEQHLNAPPPVLPEMDGLEVLVAQLLEKVPDHRPDNAAEVKRTLEDIIDRRAQPRASSVTKPIAPSVRMQAVKVRGNRARLPWAAVVVLIAVALGLGALLLARPRDQAVAIAPLTSTTAPQVTPVPRAEQVAALELEPMPESADPEAPQSPAAPRPRSPRARANERPPIALPPAIDLDAELATRGLERADLEHYPPAARRGSPEEILAAVDATAAPKTILTRRLDRVGALIAACTNAPCGRELESVEAEYLELRELAVRPGLDARVARSLLLRSAQLLRAAAKLR